MRGRSMQAGMSLRFDRSPDYFALHNAHSSDHVTWLLRRDEQIHGIGSFVYRRGWVNGEIHPIVYMADLRLSRNRFVAGRWRSLMREILAAAHHANGAKLAYCSILRDNKAGHQALLRAKGDPATQFEHLRGYSNVSIVARKPWALSSADNRRVRRARSEDQSLLRDFVARQSQATQFGPVFDSAAWIRRLNVWPDFGVENFYLAFDESDELVGCLAPWDSSAINRIVLDRLPQSAEIVRRVCNALTPITGRPRVHTGPGTFLPDISLTHVFVENRSAEVLATLLDSALRDIFSAGRHATVSLCVYDDDPLWAALKRYWYVAVPMDLFWVDAEAMAAGSVRESIVPGHDNFPGFESYLV